MGKREDKHEKKKEKNQKKEQEKKLKKDQEKKLKKEREKKHKKEQGAKRDKLQADKQINGNTSTPVEAEPWNKLFSDAIMLHHQAIAGDKKAAKQAYASLNKILKMVPQNNLVKAYCGSATSLMGRDVPKPNDKLRFGKKGLTLLDEAVSAEPENVEIRCLRAFVCDALPEKYFHRTRNAIDDFNFIITRYERKPGIIVTPLYWKVLYNLGKAYKSLGQSRNAESTWQKLLSQSTDDKYRELLNQEGIQTG